MARIVKREALLLGALLAVGVFVLPFAIYFVGANIIGEYEPGATALSLAGDLWVALLRGEWAAWLLVASPYVVIQSLRAARRALTFAKA